MMSKAARRREDMPRLAPNSGGNVWPKQRCPAFTARGGAAENTCWYCVYADWIATIAARNNQIFG